MWFKLTGERKRAARVYRVPLSARWRKRRSAAGSGSDIAADDGNGAAQLLPVRSEPADRREFITASYSMAAITATPALNLLTTSTTPSKTSPGALFATRHNGRDQTLKVISAWPVDGGPSLRVKPPSPPPSTPQPVRVSSCYWSSQKTSHATHNQRICATSRIETVLGQVREIRHSARPCLDGRWRCVMDADEVTGDVGG